MTSDGVSPALAYVSSAAATVFGPTKNGLWAMLSAYFAESGTHKTNSPVAVLAGLVAPPRGWERLTVEWQRLLEEEGLTDFHMNDFAAGREPFQDKAAWTKERREALIRRLVQIVRRHVHYRTWTAIVMSDYRQIFQWENGTADWSHFVAGLACASSLRPLAEERDLFIPYVFDRGSESGRGFEELQSREVFRIGMLSKGDRAKCPPLQAADLHAFEVRKYFTDQVNGTPRLRGSLKDLFAIPEAGPGGCLMTGAKLQALLGTVFPWRAGLEPTSPTIGPDHLNAVRRVMLVPGSTPGELSRAVYPRDPSPAGKRSEPAS